MSSTTATNVPVLCVDTCAILDILRDPTRKDVHSKNHAAALALLGCAETEAQLDVRIADLVRTEYLENVEGVRKEAEAGLSRLVSQIAKLNELTELYDSPGHVDTSHWNDHVRQCRHIAERWMAVGETVHGSGSDAVVQNAFARVYQARPPAKRGKDSTKDCVILETYLDFIRKLRAAGRTERIVFLSSNTKEFAASGTGAIKEEIAGEFADIGLEYAPSMVAAKGLLGL